MRKEFTEALLKRHIGKNLTVLTGDLGFNAFEELSEAMGDHFINAGVSEQNMVSVSASLAKEGFESWVYSIAPFLYCRALEQIRNDVCFHNLPVKFVGGGGGYGYGVMGPTHHAIEDYGILLTLNTLDIFIPSFNSDIPNIVNKVGENKNPSYLRLGLDESSQNYNAPPYAKWRQLTHGEGLILIAVGPLSSIYVEALLKMESEVRPNLWCLSELPIHSSDMPEDLLKQLKKNGVIWVAEEHVANGGVAQQLLLVLIEKKIKITTFEHFCAKKHTYERYGSQKYLRKKSMLDCDYMVERINKNHGALT